MGGIDADHGDDVDLNYEPTVNPIASGGYAWVVFTSRRMYGNVADHPALLQRPARREPRSTNITPKKLWVAAIDLNARRRAPTRATRPSTSPRRSSSPATRAASGCSTPASADGSSCMTGDQCCNGYCEPGDGGALVCSNMPPSSMCSGLQEKCTTAADCCDPTNLCINGFCTLSTPQ